MKKLLIFIVSFLLFINSSFAFNENKIINKLEIEFKKLNFEQLDDVNYRLDDLMKKNNDKNILWLLTNIKKTLKSVALKKVTFVDNDYFLNFSDDKNVLWYSDNVFVAKVLRNKWLRQDINYKDLIEETLFEVEVLYNIKWNLNWNIDVVFQWWYDSKWKLVLSEGQKFLREWWIYTLVTLWNEYKIWSYKNAINEIYYNYKNKSYISKIDTKSLIENNKKVQDFIKAYPLSPYYKTKNSYRDLTKKQKESLKTFDNWFVEKFKEVK